MHRLKCFAINDLCGRSVLCKTAEQLHKFLLYMKETFYFSHDYNARRDKKLISLVMQLWAEWYWIWWQVVEMIYEKSYPYITVDDLEIISYETRVDISKIEKFFDICKKVWLFVEWEEWYYNQRILDNLERRDEIRNKRAEAGSRWWRMKQAKDKATHSKSDWEEMKDYFWECVRCWCKDQIEKDHIVAVYNWWSDWIENLQPLCKRCNTAKWPDETDYRIIHCEAKWKQMLDKWLSKDYQIVAKERKGKEIKEKKEKENKENKEDKENKEEKEWKEDISKDIWEQALVIKKWNEDINDLLEIVKWQVEFLWLIYKKWKYERERAKNIITGKDFWEVCEKANMSRIEFCKNIIYMSTLTTFWNGKINNAETLYKYYAQVYNEAVNLKAKKQKDTSLITF